MPKGMNRICYVFDALDIPQRQPFLVVAPSRGNWIQLSFPECVCSCQPLSSTIQVNLTYIDKMAENSSLYWHALRNKMQNKHQTYPSYSTPQSPTPHGSVHYNYLESFHFVDGRFKDWKRLNF